MQDFCYYFAVKKMALFSTGHNTQTKPSDTRKYSLILDKPLQKLSYTLINNLVDLTPATKAILTDTDPEGLWTPLKAYCNSSTMMGSKSD